MGGMDSMGGFGATMKTMRGMGGFGAPPGGLDGMGGMGGMSFASLIGGMGAPPGAGVPPSHEDAGEDLGNELALARGRSAVCFMFFGEAMRVMVHLGGELANVDTRLEAESRRLRQQKP